MSFHYWASWTGCLFRPSFYFLLHRPWYIEMLAVIFICRNLFLQIPGKSAKIRTRKIFVPHKYIDWHKKRQVDKTNAKVQNVYYATMVQSLKSDILNTHKLGRHTMKVFWQTRKCLCQKWISYKSVGDPKNASLTTHLRNYSSGCKGKDQNSYPIALNHLIGTATLRAEHFLLLSCFCLTSELVS